MSIHHKKIKFHLPAHRGKFWQTDPSAQTNIQLPISTTLQFYPSLCIIKVDRRGPLVFIANLDFSMELFNEQMIHEFFGNKYLYCCFEPCCVFFISPFTLKSPIYLKIQFVFFFSVLISTDCICLQRDGQQGTKVWFTIDVVESVGIC